MVESWIEKAYAEAERKVARLNYTIGALTYHLAKFMPRAEVVALIKNIEELAEVECARLEEKGEAVHGG